MIFWIKNLLNVGYSAVFTKTGHLLGFASCLMPRKVSHFSARNDVVIEYSQILLVVLTSQN
jgi:hypothetical protein